MFSTYAELMNWFVALLKVARFLVKTVSQLGSGKKPVGTTAYIRRAEHLMQCRSNVRQGTSYPKWLMFK